MRFTCISFVLAAVAGFAVAAVVERCAAHANALVLIVEDIVLTEGGFPARTRSGKTVEKKNREAWGASYPVET